MLGLELIRIAVLKDIDFELEITRQNEVENDKFVYEKIRI